MPKKEVPERSRRVKAVCVSEKKGIKRPVSRIKLIEGLGVEGDFHARGGERQVSLLAQESVNKTRLKLEPGSFGENIIAEDVDLVSFSIGQKITIGGAALEISKIGKECVERCAIYYQTGDCIMPREGVFARVIKGGIVRPGDEIKI